MTVIFTDSGMGGLPYFSRFARRNPEINLIYLADRANFPYGPKSKESLVSLLTDLVSRLARAFNPALIVLACNTASVSALEELRARFPEISFVGTVPAVKPAALASKTGIIGVLGTERTVEDSYMERLSAGTGRAVKIVRAAAPELVTFVENDLSFAEEKEKRAAAERYVARFRKEACDGIVLGCTHFLFLKKEFREAAAPDITIYDSVDGVCRRAEAVLEAGACGGGKTFDCREKAGPVMLVTGSPPPSESLLRHAREAGLVPEPWE